MAAAEIVINPVNLQKLESFLNDSSYREAIENSCNFNSRLCAERRMRMPFLDPQTGVAQNHCNLFMNRKQRMPGAREGQIYTYPSQRWRKARRQYLTLKSARWGWASSADNSLADGSNSLSGLVAGLEGDGAGPLSVDATADTDSRDGSQAAPVSKEDMSKEWFYDELAMEELDGLDDPPTPESDSDYCEDSYGGGAGRRRGAGTRGAPREKGARPGRRPKPKPEATPSADTETTPTKGRGGKTGGRGRRKAAPPTPLPYEVPGDSEKPFGCELCGARYKTRPGLTYHYSHSHKEGGAGDAAAADQTGSATATAPTTTPTNAPTTAPTGSSPTAVPAVAPQPDQSAATAAAAQQGPLTPHHEYQDSYVTFLNNPSAAAGGGAPRRSKAGGSSSPPPRSPSAPPSPPAVTPPVRAADAAAAAPSDDEDEDDDDLMPPSGAAHHPHRPSLPRRPGDKASPSPYCDFCLGDQSENKKTGTPEELVSCSDCGRSGHPTCLQFTDNMIVSVRKYRWQCIECKCCSVCGTSDNDDQLLFCDDCDRGYHMYCLVPPLSTQPEGTWSCALCIRDFHTK